MDIPYEEDDFEAYTVHTKFQGTMMSSSGFYSGTKDTIDLYLPKEPETILVTNKEAQTTATTIYSEEGLLGNDPYEVFLGGNYGLLNIQTSSQSGRKLLCKLFKCSTCTIRCPMVICSIINLISLCCLY